MSPSSDDMTPDDTEGRVNERVDDQALDEYLQRDSDVSQHYRNIDSTDVPPALDSAVLAQAREAVVRKSNRKPAWTRWTAPIALAASLVLGVAIVLEIGVEERVALPAPKLEQMTTRDTPADATVAEAIEQVTEQPPMKPNAQTSLSAPKVDEPPAAPPPATVSDRMFKRSEPARADERSRTAAGPAESDAALSRAVAELKEEAVATASNRAAADADKYEQEARREAQLAANSGFAQASGQVAPYPTAVSQASSPVVNLPQAAQAPRLAPKDWLEQIRELRREGKVLEADEQWREFSKAYPDFQLAVDDFARPRP